MLKKVPQRAGWVANPTKPANHKKRWVCNPTYAAVTYTESACVAAPHTYTRFEISYFCILFSLISLYRYARTFSSNQKAV